jgi:hypothetical protein
MVRLPDALLPKGTAYGHRHMASLDLAYGGQQGMAPALRQWVSNQSHVKSNLLIFVLEAPKFMSLMNTPKHWYSGLRALIELHPLSVTGFNAGLEVAVHEKAVGGAGEMQQSYTNVTRARTVPVINWVDVEGNLIQHYLEYWIRFGLMDPASKIPLATTRKDYKTDDWLADWYAATIMAIEPNRSHNKAMRGWITTNFFPLSTGDIAGTRNLSAENEVVDLNITFAGLSESNLGTLKCCQTILSSISTKNADPWLSGCFVAKADSNIASATHTGYRKGVDDIVETSIKYRS